MSLGMMVTLLAWMQHSTVSSISAVMYASAASCAHRDRWVGKGNFETNYVL